MEMMIHAHTRKNKWTLLWLPIEILAIATYIISELISKYKTLNKHKEIALVIWAVPVAWSEPESHIATNFMRYLGHSFSFLKKNVVLSSIAQKQMAIFSAFCEPIVSLSDHSECMQMQMCYNL